MKVEVLFPEICNLYGDLGNIRYLKESCKEIEVINTNLNDEPYFAKNKPSLIYMGTMTENSQEIVIKKLEQYKERIKELIDEGVYFFLTGNALEIFGKEIENEDGTKIKCLNLYETVAKRKMMNRFNSLYVGEFEKMTIVGFKSQFTQSYIDTHENYFIETKRSCGINEKTMKEGIKINNFLATYVIGPFLVLNPPFTKWLLKQLGVKKPKLAFEKEAMDAYKSRVKDYTDTRRGIYYH